MKTSPEKFFPDLEIVTTVRLRSGDLLKLPEDFAPAEPETPRTAEQDSRTRKLLAEEDAHLKSIGLTWEELQEYQRKLLR